MRIKREDDIVPDTSALCGFAIAMLLIIVLCWTLMCSVGGDATLFEGGAFSHEVRVAALRRLRCGTVALLHAAVSLDGVAEAAQCRTNIGVVRIALCKFLEVG